MMFSDEPELPYAEEYARTLETRYCQLKQDAQTLRENEHLEAADCVEDAMSDLWEAITALRDGQEPYPPC